MHVYMSNNRYQLNPLEEYLCLGQTSWPIYNPINFTFHLYRNQRRNMWVQKDKIRVRRTILTYIDTFIFPPIIQIHIYHHSLFFSPICNLPFLQSITLVTQVIRLENKKNRQHRQKKLKFISIHLQHNLSFSLFFLFPLNIYIPLEPLKTH